ncbi:MAG: type III-A CRISPR-associated RAMP protein Csm5 [Spirochaetales bacterium]|nr:type III-A CRISPR-associated RAMP protein Csm5 [Spirochaetales bacterium]
MKEIHKIKIEPLTAVHIGSGNSLTLLDYKLANTSSGVRKYVRFSSDSILNRITTDEKLRNEFEVFSLNNDMKSLQAFFHKNMKNEDVSYLCLPTKEFEKKYDENLKKDPLQNACEVLEMYRPSLKLFPSIPGSSIKGSIRTALIDSCVRDVEGGFDFYKAKKSRNFENQILQNKDAKTDPFRAIYVGDCNFTTPLTQGVGILQIINGSSGHLSEKNSTQVQAEVILGKIVSKESVPQSFSLAIDNDLQKSGSVSKRFFIKDIMNECNYFYGENFKLEYEHFYKNSDSSKIEFIDKLFMEIKDITENDSENSFIIRLGRWSQFEFVTLYDEKHNFGTSRTVLNYDGQYLPMGWCKCTVAK